MQSQINTLKLEMIDLRTTQATNHKENRKDIHDLRNEVQKLILTLPQAIREGLDSMGDKVAKQISDAIIPLQARTEKVENRTHDIELRLARMGGYAAAGAVGAGLIFEAAKVGLERLIR